MNAKGKRSRRKLRGVIRRLLSAVDRQITAAKQAERARDELLRLSRKDEGPADA